MDRWNSTMGCPTCPLGLRDGMDIYRDGTSLDVSLITQRLINGMDRWDSSKSLGHWKKGCPTFPTDSRWQCWTQSFRKYTVYGEFL